MRYRLKIDRGVHVPVIYTTVVRNLKIQIKWEKKK
jgi:hypothetical protein